EMISTVRWRVQYAAMKLRTFPAGMAVLVAMVACSSGPKAAAPSAPEAPASASAAAPAFASGAGPAAGPAAAPPASSTLPAATAVPAGHGPVGERAQLLREAADNLDKAQAALDAGNRNLAERLFSTAELQIGSDLLAPLAGPFREGAPPR